MSWVKSRQLPRGNNDLNFWFARDQVMQLWNSSKFVWQSRQANKFYAAIAVKLLQTRTEKEIEQLLHDKGSKSTKEVFNEDLLFLIWINVYDLFILHANYWDL